MALESASGDVSFLVRCVLKTANCCFILLDSSKQLKFVLQDEVVELFFSYLDSSLKTLNDKIRKILTDETDTILEDLYCSSSTLGFFSIAGKVVRLRALIKDHPRNRITAQSEFFFLKCEAQIAWTEWYCHRSLIEYTASEQEPKSREDSLAITHTACPSEESAFSRSIRQGCK